MSDPATVAIRVLASMYIGFGIGVATAGTIGGAL